MAEVTCGAEMKMSILIIMTESLRMPSSPEAEINCGERPVRQCRPAEVSDADDQ